MADADSTDFQAYLESICSDEQYLGWQDFYTPTDALHGQSIEKKQPPRRLNLSLMVQTIGSPPEREVAGEEKAEGEKRTEREEKAEKEQVKRLEVLAGLRKYAENHVVLVGKPGSGKSTALERLLWEEADKARTQLQGKIPVLVELRRYKTSVLGIIGDFLFQHGCRLNEAEIKQLLLAGRFLLLVDGWNELPDDKARGDVKIFREKYQRVTPMIFTTRELAEDIGIEKKLVMQPLTEAQMQQFVLTYLPEKGERLLKQLQGRLRELGETPLLLWMLCVVFKHKSNIPLNLGLVFRGFAQSYDKEIKQDVSTDESRKRWPLLLQHLAFEMMRGKTATDLRVRIPKQEAEDILTQFLVANPFGNRRECTSELLNDLLNYHLIQLTNSNQEIEFHHQLLQEYYAAERLLVQLPQLSDDTLKRDYLNYLKWTEPLALMLALVEDEQQALRVVKLALEVDLQLGARLAGDVKPQFQKKTVDLVVKLEIPQNLKVEFLALTRSEKAITALVQALNHHNYDVDYYMPYFDWKLAYVAWRATKALENIGNYQAVTALVQALNHQNSDVCWQAAKALGNIGNQQAVTALVQALDNENYNVRRSAVAALENIDNQQACNALIYALNHQKSDVYISAIEALKNIGNQQAVDALVQALNHQNYDVYWRAAEALGEIGNQQALDALIQALNHEESNVRASAAKALGKIGNQQAVPTLVQALNEQHYYLPITAAEALGKIGNKQAVYALIQALNHEESNVRITAYKVLENIVNQQDFTAFVQILNDRESYVRASAAEALGRIGNQQAVPALVQALNDREYYVCASAAEALGKIGNQQAVPALVQVLNELNYYDLRRKAAEALGKIGNQQAVPALVQALNDRDSALRGTAAEALVNIGIKQVFNALLQAFNAVAALVKICNQALNVLVKVFNAIAGLVNIGKKHAFNDLVNALKVRESDVRGREAKALAQALNREEDYILIRGWLEEISNQQAVNALVQVFNASESDVRKTAAEALAKIGNPKVFHILVWIFNYTKDAEARWRVAEALVNIGDQQAVDALVRVFDFRSYDACWSSAQALANISSPELLPRLIPYLKTKNNGLDVLELITAIQNRCKYYNYEIYTSPVPEKQKPENPIIDTLNTLNQTLKTMSETPKNDFRGASFGNFGSVTGNIQGDVNNIGTQHNYAPERNLAESAAEIQQLLEQLAKNNQTIVQSDNQAVVVSAIHEEIKRNPTIKARLLNALKAGGTEALKQALEAIFKNPAVSISVETIKGFIEAE